MNKEIEIPEGYEAIIEGNKVIIELKESEDERIRKELLEEIEFIIPHDDETDGEGLILPSYHARIDRYKSYLEKQKEQKHKIACWKSLGECLDIPDGHHVVGWFHKGDFRLGIMCNGLFVDTNGLRAEQPKDVFYIPNADEEFVYAEQKSAEWSEEEERHLYNAIEAVKYVYDISEGTNGFKCIEFLKSLRPQPHWKPSEEQMKALEDAFRKDGGNEYRKVINSLYCDLQKLL